MFLFTFWSRDSVPEMSDLDWDEPLPLMVFETLLDCSFVELLKLLLEFLLLLLLLLLLKLLLLLLFSDLEFCLFIDITSRLVYPGEMEIRAVRQNLKIFWTLMTVRKE